MKGTNQGIYSLFPKRNFWTGFSSILCLSGDPHKFNYSKDGAEADRKALRSDWEQIGKDIYNAISITLTN